MYQRQFAINIIKVLAKHVTGFSHLQNDPELQNQPRCPLPADHKTQFYPLHASTIEEASVKGVHDDVYLTQLKRNPNDLNEYAIPTINDQLTNARIQGAQIM